jgi:hypothetical protein
MYKADRRKGMATQNNAKQMQPPKRDGTAEAFGTPEELLKTNEYYQIFRKGKS